MPRRTACRSDLTEPLSALEDIRREDPIGCTPDGTTSRAGAGSGAARQSCAGESTASADRSSARRRRNLAAAAPPIPPGRSRRAGVGVLASGSVDVPVREGVRSNRDARLPRCAARALGRVRIRLLDRTPTRRHAPHRLRRAFGANLPAGDSSRQSRWAGGSRRSAWGQGYATEGAAAALDEAFTTLGLQAGVLTAANRQSEVVPRRRTARHETRRRACRRRGRSTRRGHGHGLRDRCRRMAARRGSG